MKDRRARRFKVIPQFRHDLFYSKIFCNKNYLRRKSGRINSSRKEFSLYNYILLCFCRIFTCIRSLIKNFASRENVIYIILTIIKYWYLGQHRWIKKLFAWYLSDISTETIILREHNFAVIKSANRSVVSPV